MDHTTPLVSRMPDGSARRYTSVGSYPIAWHVCEESVCCPDCAVVAEDESSGCYFDAKAFINWEDVDLYCDDCDARIEHAYSVDEDC